MKKFMLVVLIGLSFIGGGLDNKIVEIDNKIASDFLQPDPIGTNLPKGVIL